MDNQLWAEIRRYAVSRVRTLVGRRDVDDLVQDVMVDAWRDFNKCRGDWRPWLDRVCFTTLADAARRKSPDLVSLEDGGVERLPSGEANPEDALLMSEMVNAPTSDLAKRAGVSESTVRRAKREMRKR